MLADVEIRWMIRRDLAEVCAIEAEAFEHPWTEAEFVRVLQTRNTIGMVAEDRDEKILGHFVYELRAREIEILTLAVAENQRRRGIGRAMLAKMIGKLSPGGRTRVSCLVRESNLAAQLFLQAGGMRASAVLKQQYLPLSEEDGYAFEFRLGNQHAPANRLRQFGPLRS